MRKMITAWKYSKYFWFYKGQKLKSLRIVQKSFLDNKKVIVIFHLLGGSTNIWKFPYVWLFFFESFPNLLLIPVNPYSNSTERSYKVYGFTKDEDLWNWKNFTCSNPETCWGSKKRFLEIQHLNHRWLFNFYTMINDKGILGNKKIRKTTERLYIRFEWSHS